MVELNSSFKIQSPSFLYMMLLPNGFECKLTEKLFDSEGFTFFAEVKSGLGENAKRF